MPEITDTHVIVTGTRMSGFGFRAESVPFRDRALIVLTEEFERLARECKPSGYYSYGLNAGGARDGLMLRVSKQSGIRYLVSQCGSSFAYEYADAGSLPRISVGSDSVLAPA